MRKKFYSSHWFVINQIFSLFPIIKTIANYTEICRVGKLEADFQLVLLVHFFFLKTSQYCCETPIIQIQQRKLKHIFYTHTHTHTHTHKNKKTTTKKQKQNKNTLLEKLHTSDQLLAANLILG